MRERMKEGRPGPIIGYVGRLGAEKNLDKLRNILDGLPQPVNLCFVGDGPNRKELEEMFSDTSTTFMGMLTGEELSSVRLFFFFFFSPFYLENDDFLKVEIHLSRVAGIREHGRVCYAI